MESLRCLIIFSTTPITPASSSVTRSSTSRCFTAARKSRSAASRSASRAFIADFRSSLSCSRSGMATPKRLRRAGRGARLAATIRLDGPSVELGRQHLRAHALEAALDRGGVLALALGGGLLVELARAKLREEPGLLHGALEAAKRDVEGLVFLDSDDGHRGGAGSWT